MNKSPAGVDPKAWRHYDKEHLGGIDPYHIHDSGLVGSMDAASDVLHAVHRERVYRYFQLILNQLGEDRLIWHSYDENEPGDVGPYLYVGVDMETLCLARGLCRWKSETKRYEDITNGITNLGVQVWAEVHWPLMGLRPEEFAEYSVPLKPERPDTHRMSEADDKSEERNSG